MDWDHYPVTCQHQESNSGCSSDKQETYRCTIQAVKILGVHGKTGALVNRGIFIRRYVPQYDFAVPVFSVASGFYQKIYKSQNLLYTNFLID